MHTISSKMALHSMRLAWISWRHRIEFLNVARNVSRPPVCTHAPLCILKPGLAPERPWSEPPTCDARMGVCACVYHRFICCACCQHLCSVIKLRWAPHFLLQLKAYMGSKIALDTVLWHPIGHRLWVNPIGHRSWVNLIGHGATPWVMISLIRPS